MSEGFVVPVVTPRMRIPRSKITKKKKATRSKHDMKKIMNRARSYELSGMSKKAALKKSWADEKK